MKQLAIFLSLFLSANLNAQKQQFSVNPSQIAFYGCNNLILLQNPGKTKLYAIDTNYCNTFQKNGYFFIRPVFKFGHDSCKIVLRTTDKKVIKTDTLTVYVKSYETGRASIGESNGYISKEKLMATDSITLIPPYLMAGQSSYRILKYRLISIPKAGWMEEVSVIGNKITSGVKTMLNRLNPGDMIVFDGIRAKSDIFGIEKPIAPFAVTVTANGGNATAFTFRIEGFIKQENGQVLSYIFPKRNDEQLASNIMKDSIWKYYKYDYINDRFQLESEEFYRNAQLDYRIVYINDSICSNYRLISIAGGGDSIYRFEQYFRNGQLYQKGLVLKSTAYSSYRQFRFGNNRNLRELPMHLLALSHVPEEFFPNAYWQVYDTSGQLKMSLEWTFKEDTSYQTGCVFTSSPFEPINMKYYYLIPKNEILIYNKEGEIIERLFPEE